MIGLLFFIGLCYLIYRVVKRFRREGGYGDEDKGPGRGGPPRDEPELPLLPLGTGPVLRYVPDEWVEEFWAHTPRWIHPPLKSEEAPKDPDVPADTPRR